MAKITTPRLPEATEEYSREQVSQLIQTLEQVIFILNNTYVPEVLKDQSEAFSFFMGDALGSSETDTSTIESNISTNSSNITTLQSQVSKLQKQVGYLLSTK
tara:strand:+ start:118 stop:423 length:306 start_codon:yes stop_codon:yes gene_type:complete